MESDSESEFWERDSTSQTARFWHLEQNTRQNVSTSTASTDDQENSSDISSPSSESDDESAVERELIHDTESESSQKHSREVSFNFSQLESRNSSGTSLDSSSSYDETTGRKRPLQYENTWGMPIIPSNQRPKRPKNSIRSLAASSSRVQESPTVNAPRTQPSTSSARRDIPPGAPPRTPSRRQGSTPSRGSASRIRAIEEALSPSTPSTPHQTGLVKQPESPTPRYDRVKTPALDRLCNSVSQLIGFRAGGSAALPEDVCFVAHNGKVQMIMDEMHIAWGVQYEVARGVSRNWWSWDDVTRDVLEKLRGPNQDAAAKVSQLLSPNRPSTAGMVSADLQLWAELDREELAICEGRLRGLGPLGESEGTENCYGGKIQQMARLEESGGKFQLLLAPMEMRKSTRFARFLGSRRILQVSIPRDVRTGRGDDLRRFFSQKFVLCGRVFVAFGAKDGKVFLMETREDYERPLRVPGDEQRMTLEEFVAWHNPMDRLGNYGQAVSKWATRFDLGLSVSVPVLAFDPDKIFNIEDKYVFPGVQKPPAENIYTDGCGYMNCAALSLIGKRMAYKARPTAVQGRICGSKGLWMLHPSPQEQDINATPKIWIRNSQRKIWLDYANLHRAHCIFDLVAPPRVTVPSRLSRLTILNLAHNGVPPALFAALMRETLDEQVRALTQWALPQDMRLLWNTVNHIGHVTGARMQQYALGASRALGLSGRIREDDDVPSDEPPNPVLDILNETGERAMLSEEDQEALLAELVGAGPASSVLRDKVTGEPFTIHGVAMDLIQAGFHPLTHEILYDKLKKIISNVIEDVIREFHVNIPLSAEAFIVPDPHGVLEENQIHFKSTEALKPPLEDLFPHTLLGDVLIYRNPNRLPSDVQKVTAVQHEKLAEYTDVIVLPTKGPCSFASMLAGGDYDGDVCVCIYDPRIVQSFKNAPLTRQDPNFLKDNFEDQGLIEKVSAVTEQMSRLANDPDARRKKLQEALLSDISLPPIGAYSIFHENAAYVHGYDHPKTVRNAFMFNTVLDSRKSGLRVKPEVLKRDKREYDRKRPECLQGVGAADHELSLSCNVVPLIRPSERGVFILDQLHHAGKQMRDEHLRMYEGLENQFGAHGDRDPDLLRPYQKLVDDPLFQDDLARIRAHVLKHIDLWRGIAGESKVGPQTPSRSGRGRGRGKPGVAAQRAKWKDLAQSFSSGPELPPDSVLMRFSDATWLGGVDMLRASCAYGEKPRFAWSVAFQVLCRIKAASVGAAAMTSSFADAMSIPSSVVRVLEQSRLGMT